jgi:hypothetical protein
MDSFADVTKECGNCKLVKNISEFYRQKASKDGYKKYCKECSDKASVVRRENNRSNRKPIPKTGLCKKCKKIKNGTEFGLSVFTTTGINSTCKECDCLSIKAWQRENPKKVIESRHRSVYGLSPEQFDAILKAQGGGCAICKFIPGPDDRALDIDHRHVDGWKEMPPEERRLYVRGMLCDRCNVGLGLFDDKVETLHEAISYLKKWERCDIDFLGRTSFESKVPLTSTTFRRSLKISRDMWNSLLLRQGSACTVCKYLLEKRGKRRAHLDHNHTVGFVRGILCHMCNTGIGCFEDSVELLQNAINYLTFYKAPNVL